MDSLAATCATQCHTNIIISPDKSVLMMEEDFHLDRVMDDSEVALRHMQQQQQHYPYEFDSPQLLPQTGDDCMDAPPTSDCSMDLEGKNDFLMDEPEIATTTSNTTASWNIDLLRNLAPPPLYSPPPSRLPPPPPPPPRTVSIQEVQVFQQNQGIQSQQHQQQHQQRGHSNVNTAWNIDHLRNPAPPPPRLLRQPLLQPPPRTVSIQEGQVFHQNQGIQSQRHQQQQQRGQPSPPPQTGDCMDFEGRNYFFIDEPEISATTTGFW